MLRIQLYESVVLRCYVVSNFLPFDCKMFCWSKFKCIIQRIQPTWINYWKRPNKFNAFLEIASFLKAPLRFQTKHMTYEPWLLSTTGDAVRLNENEA